MKRELIRDNEYDDENGWILEVTRWTYSFQSSNPVVALRWYELLMYLRDTSRELRWYFGPCDVRFGDCGWVKC